MLYLEHLSIGAKNGLPNISFKDKMGRSLSFTEGMRKILNRLFNYVVDLELLFVKITGCIPIYSLRYLVYIAAGAKIHPSAHIHMGAEFFYPAGVEIDEGSIIGKDAFLDGRDKLKIGKHVDIASEVMIYNSEHDINSEDFAPITASVIIEDYVFIGPRVIILPGVKIGKGAVVGAGALVTKDVPEFAIVGGVPAQIIGQRKLKDLHYKLGRARLFQ